MYQLSIHSETFTDPLAQNLNHATRFAYLSYRGHSNKVNMEIKIIQLKCICKNNPPNENKIFSVISVYFLCTPVLFKKKKHIEIIVFNGKYAA